MTKSRLKFSIALATALALIVLGILFAVSALDLFLSGGQRPYSRERVGEYLFPLIPAAVLTVCIILLGFILIRSQKNISDGKSKRTALESLKDYSPRFEGIELPEEEGATVSKERKKRAVLNFVFISTSLLFFAGAVCFVIFLCDFSVEKLNSDVMRAYGIALPLFGISVGIHIPRLYLLEGSAIREQAALKEAVKKGVKPSAVISPKVYHGEVFLKNAVRIVILCAAVVFIILGVSNGGMESVLGKAIKICTECIGLG